MDNELIILLSAKLNESQSIQNISGQIANIQKGLASLKISLDLGDFKTQLEKTFGEFEKVTKKMNTSTNASGITSEMEKYRKSIMDVTHEYKLGLKTQTEYISVMQKAVFNSNGGYSSDFLSLEMKEQERLVKDINVAVRERDQALKTEYTTQVAIGKEIEKQEDLYARIESKKSNLKDIQVSHGKADPEEAERLAKAYDKIAESVRNGTTSASQGGKEVSRLESEVKKYTVSAKDASSTTNDFSDKLKRFVQFHLVGEALRQTKQALKEMVTQVKEIDSSLVELQKVSDLSGESLKSFTHEAFILGESVAKTGKQVLDATTVFKRAGFDLSESLDLSESALIMTNVAENIKSVESASSSMIAVMRGYGMETSKAMHIVDAFNEVSNTQAINFDQLADGAMRISGVMNQQGNSFEEMLGLITGGTEVLRNVEKVSTGLQTITQRIAGVSEETGAVTEESTKLVAKMGDEFQRFAGIKLTDAQGQMRDTYDILKDMAQIFPTLDRNTQQYLTQLAAGQRQANVLQAILDNWENVEKATESALNSAGSAMKEQEAYLNSIEGKTNQLKSAMQSLAITTIDSNFIKGIIDATTAVVKLIDSLGGLIPILTAIGGLFTIIKASAISETILAIGSAFSVLAKAVVGGSAAMTAAGATTMAFVPIAGAIAIAIAGVVMAFNHLSKSSQRAEESVQTLKQELSDLNTEIQDGMAKEVKMQDLSSQYDELRKLKEAQGLTNEQQADFTRIQNEIKEIMPEVNSYMDSQGNVILDQTTTMEGLNEQLRVYLEGKRQEAALKANEVASVNISQYEKEKEDIKKLAEYHELLKRQKSNREDPNYKNTTEEEASIVNRMMHLREYNKELFKGVRTAEDVEDAIKALKETHKSLFDEIQDGVTTMMQGTDAWTGSLDNQKDAILRYMAQLDPQMIQHLSKGFADGSINVNDFVNNLKKTPTVLEYIAEAIDDIPDLTTKFSNTEEEVAKLTKTIKDSVSEISTLQGAVEELDKKRELSSNTISSLIEQYPELIALLGDEQAVRKFLIGEIENQEKVHAQATFNMIQYDKDYFNNKILGNEHLVNEISKLYGIDLKNFNNLAEAKAEVEQKLINAIGDAWAKLYSSNYDAFQKQLSAFEGQVAEGDIHAEKQLRRMYDAAKAVESIRDAAKFERVVVDFTGAGGSTYTPKETKAKKEKKTSKSDLPKYLTQGFDDISKEILAKSDKLEREIAQANTKILNAQLLGNTEEELALQTQLEGMYARRIELEKEKSIALIGLRKKVASELGKQKFDVLKGVNLESITEKQLSDINRKIDAQIDKANKAKNDKLANSYKVQQDMINEHAKAIMDANNNINSISLNVRKLENESIEKSIELLERKYEIESAISSKKTKDLEYEQMLYEQDSQEYINIERQKLDVIYGERQKAEDMYNNLRERGYDSESDIVKKYHDLWYDYNVKIRQMQMETAKRNKDNELKNLKEKQAHTEQLISMTMDMLRSQYQEERELIEKNSKAKQDALNKELEGYRNIINERKKALQDEVKKEDYQTQLDQYNKELSDMKSQAALLGKDETAVVEYEKLLEDIAKKESELKKYQRDYNLGLQQESLDKELSQYEDKIKSEIDKLENQKKDELSVIDKTLKNEVRLREEAIRLIESKNKNLFDQLNKWAEENGTKTKEEIEKAWNGAYDAINVYNQGQLDVLDTLQNIADKIKEIEKSSWTDWTPEGSFGNSSGASSGSNNSSGGSSGGNSSSKVDSYTRKQMDKMIDLGNNMKGSNKSETDALLKQQQDIARTIGAFFENNIWYIMLNGKKVPIRQAVEMRHNGLLGGRVGDGMKPNEKLMKLTTDEWVINDSQYKTLNRNIDALLSGNNSNKPIEINIDALMKDVKIDKGVDQDKLIKDLSDDFFKQVKNSFKIYGLRK